MNKPMQPHLPRDKFTPEDDEIIRDLAGQGKSAREVAVEFGCSRCAIIGRGRRMKPHPQWQTKMNTANLKGRPKRKHVKLHISAAVMERRAFVEISPEMLQKFADPPDTAVYLLDLKSEQCRFPYGAQSPYLFCGAPTPKEQSWCDVHAFICMPGQKS